MRKLFLLAGLCAMIISACSTDESNETEQRQAQIREQIVGVWRSGDYWVSFSEDGFMTTYLSEEHISEGDYTINKDTVRAESSMYWYYTDFTVKHIDNSTLECSVVLNGFEGSFTEKINDFTFTKTDEEPCPKNHILIGKNFQYDMDVMVRKGDFTNEYDTVPGTAYCEVGNYFYSDRRIKVGDKTIEGGIQDYYVYRPPYLYYRELYIYGPNKSKDAINVLRIDFDNDSIVASKI